MKMKDMMAIPVALLLTLLLPMVWIAVSVVGLIAFAVSPLCIAWMVIVEKDERFGFITEKLK